MARDVADMWREGASSFTSDGHSFPASGRSWPDLLPCSTVLIFATDTSMCIRELIILLTTTIHHLGRQVITHEACPSGKIDAEICGNVYRPLLWRLDAANGFHGPTLVAVQSCTKTAASQVPPRAGPDQQPLKLVL